MFRRFRKIAYDKGYRVGRYGESVTSPIWNPCWIIEDYFWKEWLQGMREGILANTSADIAERLRIEWGME